MSGIDSQSSTSVNRMVAKLNSELKIRCTVRDNYMAGCYNINKMTNAKKSKQLHIGTVGLDEVTDEKGDIEVGHVNIGANYLVKKEFAKELCFSGADLRHSETSYVEKAATRLMEADDIQVNLQAIAAVCGPMLVGDQCKPELEKDICCIEHDDVGITPEKLTDAATAINRWCPGEMVIIGITPDIYRQMTQFDEFTNSDYLLGNGTGNSVYHGQILQPKNWYNIRFKMMPDHIRMDAANGECELLPTIKADRYIPEEGTWDEESYVRYLPVWTKKGLDYEDLYSASVSTFDVWQQRRKPKGTMAMRYDHGFGFAMNNPKERAIIKVVEKNKDLCV